MPHTIYETFEELERDFLEYGEKFLVKIDEWDFKNFNYTFDYESCESLSTYIERIYTLKELKEFFGKVSKLNFDIKKFEGHKFTAYTAAVYILDDEDFSDLLELTEIGFIDLPYQLIFYEKTKAYYNTKFESLKDNLGDLIYKEGCIYTENAVKFILLRKELKILEERIQEIKTDDSFKTHEELRYLKQQNSKELIDF
ncbi:MAG: hypothetical protein SOR31_03745 [Parvimonas sp.]|uniref:hypothetical protein n=1 Tax=Parvimonas sp. TaxID=1944660 RepID=UPI002A748AA3|nr:hypothetical protein [Parvimonas sp.]MDY3050730.1 hypothetical protein [Parvimonas sp.]